jgi:hypothetical protein
MSILFSSQVTTCDWIRLFLSDFNDLQTVTADRTRVQVCHAIHSPGDAGQGSAKPPPGSFPGHRETGEEEFLLFNDHLIRPQPNSCIMSTHDNVSGKNVKKMGAKEMASHSARPVPTRVTGKSPILKK